MWNAFMNRVLYVLCVLLLSACGRAGVAPAAAPASEARDRYLAYEHTIAIDVEEGAVKPLFDKLIEACAADRENSCSVLNSTLEGGRYEGAQLRMRAKTAGVNKLLAMAASGGELARQETRVEDLARPVSDNAKRLEMLRSYQQKLSELERRPSLDADALIKLSKEQANVQAELEEANGQNAHLMARVNLDILTVQIQSRNQQSFIAPIRRALIEFRSNLSSGIASMVTGVAYLLPWLLVLSLCWWLGRKLWRRVFRK
jgi:hypothetical protein